MHRPSMTTDLAVANELVQAVGSAQRAGTFNSTGTTTDDPQMVGFGSGVHQYLNQLLALVYSKTTTLLAANMVLVSLLLSTRTSIKITLDNFYIAAVFFFSLSAITSTIVLFPRLRRDKCGGLIFWRSILAAGSADKYYASVQKLTKAGVEEE